MEIRDRKLFLSYAIPCLAARVRRGELSASEQGSIEREFLERGDISSRVENLFPVALKMLELEARNLGKPHIDSDVIRSYFSKSHADHVRRQMEVQPDLDPRECVCHTVTIVDVHHAEYTVEGPVGRVRVSKWTVPEAKRGDKLRIHYTKAVERVP
ncbi:MAG: hypothetical protein JW834_04580 [Candidatus Diapherotrites archaeon]|nr:hypothetical protein [Candidatus Diapherotrites archaeon]